MSYGFWVLIKQNKCCMEVTLALVKYHWLLTRYVYCAFSLLKFVKLCKKYESIGRVLVNENVSSLKHLKQTIKM